MMSPLSPRTEDGFEMMMGTNHLGHFLLARLLLPLMRATEGTDKRVVVVASMAHEFAKDPIRLHDLNW